MVAVNDEHRNVELCQTRHLLAERYKRAQISILGIVDIASDDQEIGFGMNRVIDNTRQRNERRRLQLVPQLPGRLRQSPKRTVQMQIRSMNKSKRFHDDRFKRAIGQIRS